MNRFAQLALVSALAMTAVVSSGPGFAETRAPYSVVETGRGYDSLQDAIDAIGDGTGTIALGPFRFEDCAVQTRGDILYKSVEPGQAVFDGVTCEGKAALVLRGRSARIEGLVFANIRVPDANGAGIRLEKGDLSVGQSWFRDSQQGILTANGEPGSIVVDKSTFTRLGTCEGAGGCAHSIYVGLYGALTVTRSRFEQGRGGHYVKSRAGKLAVLNSSFDDSGGRETNYMIDVTTGAQGKIAGNWFVQGKSKENYTALVSVAPEGKQHSSNGLTIEGNDARIAPGAGTNTIFVVDWSGDRLAIGANAVGQGLRRFERR
jgi:hypothetical protein